MGTVRIALFASLAVCSASVACAQYGLYGSPEMLNVPQQQATQVYAAPTNYPTTATPMPQAVPAPAYYPPQPQYRTTARYQPTQATSQYRYPAQPPAMAMYQPYQPGAQYRYPGPYARPMVRTAAIEQQTPIQPMPAPPGMPAAEALAPAPSIVPTPSIAPAPQGSGMMNQMLAEQGCGENGCGGEYNGVLGRFGQAACGSNSEACGYDGSCGQGCYCPWYASVSALVMGRSEGRRLWTSSNPDDETEQWTNTQIPMQWKWGGEVRFGRRFCCSCVPYALEATYWTTEAFTGYERTTNPGGYVNTPLVIDPLRFGVFDAVDWFNGAEEHRLYRRNEFHNVEVNLIREQLAWACDSPWDIGWSVGVRYFRFQEDLTFASLHQGGHWGDPAAEAYFSDNITNNLIGAQFGFDAAYNVFDCVRLFITPKIGIYDNYIDGTFQGRTGSGVNASGPYGAYPVHSTKNGLSFLTQIDVGADWQFTRNWSARAGYRVVAVSGMGLADDQFPQYMVDTPAIADIQNYSSLVLHGAFFGVTYNF